MCNPCILQVEDEETDVWLLHHAFRKAGLAVPIMVVARGQDAVDYLSGSDRYADREAYPFPGLVLLDLNLPDKPGMEVLKWIRQQPALRRLVVIALTSSNHDSDVNMAYDCGVNSYVVKTADARKRLEFAQHLKGWWLGCNEFAPR